MIINSSMLANMYTPQEQNMPAAQKSKGYRQQRISMKTN